MGKAVMRPGQMGAGNALAAQVVIIGLHREAREHVVDLGSVGMGLNERLAARQEPLAPACGLQNGHHLDISRRAGGWRLLNSEFQRQSMVVLEGQRTDGEVQHEMRELSVRPARTVNNTTRREHLTRGKGVIGRRRHERHVVIWVEQNEARERDISERNPHQSGIKAPYPSTS